MAASKTFAVNAAFVTRQPLLYLVTDGRGRPAEWLLQHVRRCLDGGVDVVQLRDKTLPDADFQALAEAMLKMTDAYGVPLVINDRVDIATAIGAPSVHVGRKDGRVEDIKRRLHPDCFLGYSIDFDNQDAPIPAVADLLGIGPIWATRTKKDAAVPMGLQALAAVNRRSTVPSVAIGGITAANIGAVIEAGCIGAAVVGELMDAEEPEAVARQLKATMAAAMAACSRQRAAAGSGSGSGKGCRDGDGDAADGEDDAAVPRAAE